MYMYMYTYMYMGKNYTLYIKDNRFAQEPNKGGLINSLLEKHYGGVAIEPTITETVSYEPIQAEPKEKAPKLNFNAMDEFLKANPPKPREPEHICTLEPKPCKHWNWDINVGMYINSLTGETYEAPSF